MHGVEFAGHVLLGRRHHEHCTASTQPPAPDLSTILDQGGEARADKSQFHGPIDRLEAIEELLNRGIGLFNLSPPRRQRLVGSPPYEMQTHLHAAKQVAAPMAEGTETLTKLFSLPLVLDDAKK